MSQFKVQLVKVTSSVKPENADNIHLTHVDSDAYQYITQKDQFKAGDIALRIPLDAIVPDEVLIKINLQGKLGGASKNRVRTLKLIQQQYYSQGLLVTPTVVLTPEQIKLKLDDYATLLGITKYEPDTSEQTQHSTKTPKNLRWLDRLLNWVFGHVEGQNNKLPDGVNYYDIENLQKEVAMWEDLKQHPLQVTEKLEGQHAVYGRRKNGEYFICSRSLTRGRVGSVNDKRYAAFWEWAVTWFSERQLFSNPILKRIIPRQYVYETAHNNWMDYWVAHPELQTTLEALAVRYPNMQIALRGELVGTGIQGNIYQFKDRQFYCFDILVGNKYLDASTLEMLKGEDCADIQFAPRLPDLEGQLALLTLDELIPIADGKSLFRKEQWREGVVIKPLQERYHRGSQRMILKLRSQIYLSKEKDN